MSQQGIYVSPCDVIPNKDRVLINNPLKLWIIEFDVMESGYNVTNGCAVVKASNPNEATNILTHDGVYNSNPRRYAITRVAEIIPSPEAMLLCEQINNGNQL